MASAVATVVVAAAAAKVTGVGLWEEEAEGWEAAVAQAAEVGHGAVRVAASPNRGTAIRPNQCTRA